MVQYSAHLQTQLLQELRTADISSLDQAISVLDDKLLSRLLLRQRPLRDPPLRDDRSGSAKDKLNAERRASAVAKAALAAKRSGKGLGKRTLEDRTVPKEPTHKPGSLVRRPVCFTHDPQAGSFCSAQSTCQKDHLDTSKPEMRLRFDAAKDAFQKRQLKKAGGDK
jgi:hypothetical protein